MRGTGGCARNVLSDPQPVGGPAEPPRVCGTCVCISHRPLERPHAAPRARTWGVQGWVWKRPWEGPVPQAALSWGQAALAACWE